MLSFVKRLAYRDRVLDHLGALLLMYPAGRQFAADFPGLPARIRTHFDEGLSPAGSALQLAAGIIVGLVAELDAGARRDILARVERLEAVELQSMASGRLRRRVTDHKDMAIFAAELIGVAIFMARRMNEEGTIAKDEYRLFSERIDQALRSLAVIAD